ncbi:MULTISPECIES: potassium channel family protein [Bacillus]|nr:MULTISPECIES: potassium channel family protein [Bacillus]
MRKLLKKEFNKNKLFTYFMFNVLVILLLIANTIYKIKEKTGNYLLIAILILLLAICLYLLIDFIVVIPNSQSSLKVIFIGSALLLSLIIITYANLYFLVYTIKGHKAFSFTGKNLSGGDFLYYSITTFTTTGYGDITSIGILSNALAASEMLVGVITDAIFMAILTAKLIKKLNN